MNLTGVSVEQGYASVRDLPGSVIVGMGDPNPEASAHAVILNHKGYDANVQEGNDAQRLFSVSQFVTSASDALWSTWRQRIATAGGVERLVVEDFSLDTCCALLLFGARLERRPVSSVAGFDESAWVDYATVWERGDFVDVAVETSPACLLTVFGHALLPVPGADPKPGLSACLQFLQEIFDYCPTPPAGGLPPTYASELRREAMAQIGFDRQQYETALHRGKTFQLLLPSSIPTSRSQRLVAVDALSLREVEPTGILKTFARTDRDNAWTHRGFAVLALHRPAEARTGNDMTISVDPATKLTLKQLWERLEELEDEKWKGARPTDNPRRIAGYLNADGTVKAGSPNEPWWDANGEYTLLGAPREDGTRLNWYEDVLPALWDMYFLTHLRRRVRFEPHLDYAGKHVHIAMWLPVDPDMLELADSERQLPDAPSFRAWLAACAMRQDPFEVKSPMQLPHPETFELLSHDGGYAVITRDGITFFREDASNVDDRLLRVTEQMASAVRSYSELLTRYSKKLQPLIESVDSEHQRMRDLQGTLRGWEEELSDTRKKLLEADAQLATLPPGFHADRLRHSLARMWGLVESRDEVRAIIDRVEDFMRLRVVKRSEKRENIYGSLLSASALAIAAGEIWKAMEDSLSLGVHVRNLITLLVYVSWFLIGLGVFWLLGIRRAP